MKHAVRSDALASRLFRTIARLIEAMKIAVYGLGYVGLTAAVCLANDGHRVLGVDVSEAKVRQINAGSSPISEHGLEDLLRRALDRNLLTCRTEMGSDLAAFDMAIVCVGTPSGSDGSHNMSFIAEVSRQIASSIKDRRARPLAVVYRSTIRPGAVRYLIQPIFRDVLKDRLSEVELIQNPEFLREGTAIQDYLHPPKVVIGTADGQPSAALDELYKDTQAPVFYTTFDEAAFIKLVDNTFHALKVAFVNEIGRTCLQSGVSPRKIHEVFIADTKLNVSPYYLRPGGPFGGSCLPKDTRAFQSIAAEIGTNTPVIDALIRSNEAHKHYLYEHCVRDLSPGSRVLMIGLAFKAGNDDLRESPKVDLARRMLQAGFRLSIFDEPLRPEKLIGQNLGYAYAHLPTLSELLIDRAEAEAGAFDLVVDTDGTASKLKLRPARVINIHAL